MLIEDVSSNEIALEDKSKEEKPTAPPSPVNMNIINELQLVVDKNNQEDLQEITKILVDVLNYPQTEIAELHTQAMKLGNFDLEENQKSGKMRLDTSSQMLGEEKKQFCPCCGFIKQLDSIKMCTSLDGIKNMGLSTYLFFATFKNLSILLTILIIVYSVFAILTNIIASNKLNSNQSLDYISISLSPKELHDTTTNRLYYYISCWLGVATIVIWIIALVGIKYKQAKDSQEYDEDTISCSDYSILVEGLPMDVNKQELQKQLNDYYQTTIKNNSRLPAVWKQPLTVAKINVGKPFYLNEESLKDEQLEGIEKQSAELKEQMINWIIERQSSQGFKRSKAEREATMNQYLKLQQRKLQKYQQLSQKIKSTLKNQSSNEATTVFITFETNNNKTVMSFIHQTGILNKLRSFCSDQHKRFSFKSGSNDISLEIRRAPEPEDIIWSNIGHNNCSSYLRKFFTFSVTALLLGVCFAIVYGLTKAQESANDNRMLSIAISLTIGIVNGVLGVVIKFLTFYQKDYTATYREASLAIKSIIAQMINSILIPVVTAYEIKNNIYQTSGLVDNIFMLGITTAIIPPIVIFIDPYNLFMKLMRCLKSRPSSKLYQNQKEHNNLHEGIEFEIGYHYIYLANVFMFVCFFVSLQPIVSVFALIGYFLMYWVQKYCVFNRYRRPIPGTDFVNNAVYRLIFLGPVIFSLGSMTWSNLSPNGIPPEALLPNLVALGISILLFLLPINTIIMGSCFSDNYQKCKKYDDERILFPSEYNRLNPSTQEEGIAEYKKYMEKKIEELKNAPQEKQAQLAQLISHNAQRAQMSQRVVMPQMGSGGFNFFQRPGPPVFMAQPQFNQMPAFMNAFMPMVPGFQPNYRPPMPQAPMVIKGGKVQVVSPYPQYQQQQQQPRQVFGPQQGVPAVYSPAPVYPQSQAFSMIPPGMNQMNPIAMTSSNMAMNLNNSQNALLQGLGNFGQNRARRF